MLKQLFYQIMPYAGGAITAFIGYYFYQKRASLDIGIEEKKAEIRQHDAPLDTLRSALDRAFGEAAASREQVRVLMENHLEHDRQDRDRFIEVMIEIKETLRSVSAELIQHRNEERERFSALMGRHDA